MKTSTFTKGNKSIVTHIESDVYDVDPKEHMLKERIHIGFFLRKVHFQKEPGLYSPSLDSIIMAEAQKEAQIMISEIERIEIPDCFKQILTSNLKKKEQIQLLKGATLTPDQLGALFLYAGNLGYKYTNIRRESTIDKYSDDKMPLLSRLCEDGSVETYGDTELTDGQQKEIILTSNFLVARILDNGEHWHCILQTKRGVSGQESGRFGSSPHLHYLSDSFGISKERFVNMLQDCKYYPTEVHIPLLDYRDSEAKKE